MMWAWNLQYSPFCLHPPSHTNMLTAITVPSFSGQSYLVFAAPLSSITTSFTLTLSLRTRTPTSLLLYATGTNESFIALELLRGVLVFRYSLGSGVVSVRGDFFPVSDGSWHRVAISIQDGIGSLTIDNAVLLTNSTLPVGMQPVFIASPLYIGGVGNFSLLHPQLSSHTSGLIGCITDFTLNGSVIDLLADARSGVGVSQCAMGLCSSTTCQNNGICVDNVNAPLGYHCLCSLGFTGENCSQGLLVTSCALCLEPLHFNLQPLLNPQLTQKEHRKIVCCCC